METAVDQCADLEVDPINLCTSVCKDLRHTTSLMSSVVQPTSKAEAAFVQRHHHSSPSDKLVGQLLVIGRSWSPDFAFETL
jgi:hypothetical protein